MKVLILGAAGQVSGLLRNNLLEETDYSLVLIVPVSILFLIFFFNFYLRYSLASLLHLLF